MKKSILLSVVLVLSGLSSFAQWELLTSGTDQSLNSVFFTDANTGYAVGSNGVILKTTNAGTSWDSLSSGTFNFLTSINFTDANTGYVVGDSGTILKTLNGGISWTSLSSGTTYPLTSICFTGADTGYAAGGYRGWYDYVGIILKTINGGISWTTVLFAVGANFPSIYFSDANTGYAVGFVPVNFYGPHIRGTILKTTDGGTTWDTSYSGPLSSQYKSLYFHDSTTGYVVGNNSGVLKTLNGGTTWDQYSIPNWLNSVYFTDINTGYAIGNGGTIVRTNDAGITWNVQSSGISSDLFSVFFTNADTGYAVGNNGIILKTTDGGEPPVGINEKPQASSLKIYPNPAREIITIELSDPGTYLDGTISVYGMTNAELIKQKVKGSKVELNVRSLPQGVYYIRLINSEKTGFGKFIKE